jgi:sterol 14-demethylase
MPELFRDPERFDPDRYAPGREEDATPFAWIPFGGGHHRCSGSAFALMQLKAIAVSLLRRWTFELTHPPESYDHDYTKMVVQPRQPCRVRYRRRATRPLGVATATAPASAAAGAGTLRIRVDRGLCQGHAVCMSEAPEVFRVDEGAGTVTVLRHDVPAAERERVARAIRHCPTRALSFAAP